MIERRTNFVSTFPDTKDLVRLAGKTLIEHHDAWRADRRYSIGTPKSSFTPTRDPWAGGGGLRHGQDHHSRPSSHLHWQLNACPASS